MASGWLIYGAYGYTGRLIATEAKRRGLAPVLAGRRRAPLADLAEKLDLEYRIAALDDDSALSGALEGIALVLHCAGPYSRTAAPMLEACLRQGVHYLDITGEIPVFRRIHSRDAEARRAGVTLLPGVGFDVVPTDCLAMKLKEALPEARRLVLAFEAHGGLSPGTARTSIEGLARGGCVRRGGRLVRVPLAWKTREFMFNNRRRRAVTIPWGDVYTAYVSTGIPDIEVYMSAGDRLIRQLRWLRWLRWVLAVPAVQGWLQRRAGGSASGPDEGRRARTHVDVVGEVADGHGHTARAMMVTPNGYTLTVHAALGVVERALREELPPGFHTPGQLMGADYAMSLPGVEFKLEE